MPRFVYRTKKLSPHTLINIDTLKTFTDERAVLPPSVLYPSWSVRKKAAENGWYIEIKTKSRGVKTGHGYWDYLRNPESVDWWDNTLVLPDFDNMPTTNTNTIPDPVASPEPKPVYIEKITDRDYKIKRRVVGDLLAKSHNYEIPENDEDDAEIVKLISEAGKLKPSFLKMEEDSWKLLVRSALRGKNVIMLGDKGEGKTMSAYALKNALGRPFFPFNFGNMQDAQTALIGKTHLDMKTGTWFNESDFVKAIQTQNAIILCDELSRCSEDASNILFTVFDENQKFLRIAEATGDQIIKVAKGVCFIATANIGFQYTGTHKLDAAMFDRWTKIEVDHLSKTDRMDILQHLFPDLVEYVIDTIASIADKIRENYNSADPKVSTCFSTRMCISCAELIYDGFSFLSAVEKTVYPEFSNENGDSSERTFVKQIVQGLYDEDKAKYPFNSQKKYSVRVDGTPAILDDDRPF